jgi:hypothetical protein
MHSQSLIEHLEDGRAPADVLLLVHASAHEREIRPDALSVAEISALAVPLEEAVAEAVVERELVARVVQTLRESFPYGISVVVVGGL